MEKPKRMETGMVDDMRDYVKKYGKLIPVSMIAAIICFGFLVFCGNIRIDTEELMNHPGSKLGWLGIGRFGLAFLKSILGLGTHNVIKSGILFFLFFLLGANLLTFAIYHFSGGKAYPYWIFLLLYVTSNIWSYQIYFSVQQAEVACAMLLLVVAAMLSMRAFFEKRGVARIGRVILSVGLLIVGLGAYQALAVYYITICMLLFVVWLDNASVFADWQEEAEQKAQNRKMICGIVGLVITFGVAYVLYRVIANTWFMTTADYMEGQMGWGKYSAIDCAKNVLRTAKNLLLGVGPRNFSFYAMGLLLALALIVMWWRETYKRKTNLRFCLRVLALIGLAASPFLMTLYMGEMLVTRSQFALPVAAAFLGMYAIDGVCSRLADEAPQEQPVGGRRRNRWVPALCSASVLFTVVAQCGYNLRLAYTDEQRFISDAAKTELLLEMLCEENGGGLPTQPIVFVGYQEADMSSWCRRTEMYGWSFYEWDYSVENPTGATHRIVGFVQAYAGGMLNEAASEEEMAQAVELAEELCDFPADGAIAVTEDVVVVRLSETCERTDMDWW